MTNLNQTYVSTAANTMICSYEVTVGDRVIIREWTRHLPVPRWLPWPFKRVHVWTLKVTPRG